MHDWARIFTDGDLSSGLYGGPVQVLFVLLLSFLIGHFIGWVYMWTHKGLSYSQAFVTSLVVIPVIVALMMILMAGSLVVAFGLLAVFAVVRFRNVLKDTRDTTFILWAIMEGLGVGTFRWSTSILAAVAVAVVFFYLRLTGFGLRHRYDAVVTFELNGDSQAAKSEMDEVMRAYCARSHLASRQLTPTDALSLSYRVLLRDPATFQQLRHELERTEGIGKVMVFLRKDESEV